MKDSMHISDQLSKLGICSSNPKQIKYNLTASELLEESIRNKEGFLSEKGSFVVYTGEHTGRSPKDKYIVKVPNLNDIAWSAINNPLDEHYFNLIYKKLTDYLKDKQIYVRDCYACSSEEYRLKIRCITTLAWHNLFCNHIFLRYKKNSNLKRGIEDFTIIDVPDFNANPKTDGTRSNNFTIINLEKKIVIIGGTKYAGEIKKSIFSILNYILPKKNVLPMHCSASIGKNNDTTIFFGLSGTGKTTLVSDENRQLIGDDEHGWSKNNVFNFEGGCYAKTINLSQKKEPSIYNAIKYCSIVENVPFIHDSRKLDFYNASITENTRAVYPLENIENRYLLSNAPTPNNIIFLTCDAYGVLPPVSKLNKNQAIYHFLSGYTSKIAGTEKDITDPVATFSACFGLAFLTLHPTVYSNMLEEKLNENKNIKIWFINTGWIGGQYGVGQRIDLNVTRVLVEAAINGTLAKEEYTSENIFNLSIPKNCVGVDSKILNPITSWSNKIDYTKNAEKLIKKYKENFKNYSSYVSNSVLSGGF